MKTVAIALLLALAPASPEIRYFRYQRPLQNLPQQSSQACAVLDAAIFFHSAPQLADLRLYRDTTETPYVIRFAAPTQATPTNIPVLNLGVRGNQTVFDADLRNSLHNSRYSDIELSINAQNFLATVKVAGSHEPNGSNATTLGSYTIFDLTAQKLGRSTILHLPESDLPYLHFQITGPLHTENIAGLSIVRTPISQSKYTTVAESSQGTQKGHSTILELTVPAHVPVDRIAFAPEAEPVNFSRAVQISATQPTQSSAPETTEPILSTSANLLRIHRTVDGHMIDEERLAIDLSGTNSAAPTKWTITIDNGDDAPLRIKSVQLQMLERNLCFDAATGASYTLYYDDSALSPPRYDYASLFTPQPGAAKLVMGPETDNPSFQPRPDNRPLTEKHPVLVWIALVAVIALLGAVAFRSAKPPAQAP